MVPVLILSAIVFSLAFVSGQRTTKATALQKLASGAAIRLRRPRKRRPFIPRAGQVSGGALDPSHPGGRVCTFLSSGRVDQNQAVTASIGTARELILVLQDEGQAIGQLIRGVSIPETYPTGMSRRSPRPVVTHQVLVPPGSDRPDALSAGFGFFGIYGNSSTPTSGNFRQEQTSPETSGPGIAFFVWDQH